MIISGICAALAVWLLGWLWSRYRAATGSPWDKLISAGHDSAVILLNKVTLLGSFVDIALTRIADVANMPEAADFVNKYLPPQYVGWTLAGFAAVNILARLRTLWHAV